mgnify:CR=1 FL=1
MMNKATFLTVTIALVLLNIFLMITNVERQNEVESLLDFIEQNHKNLDEFIIEGGRVTHPEIDYDNDSDFTLLIFIPEKSCPDCLIYEIPNLNSFHKEYTEHVDVFVIGNNKEFLNQYEAEFSALLLETNSVITEPQMDHLNPYAYLVDSKGNIQSMYYAEVGNERKSKLFYQRMGDFIETISN